MKKKKAFFFVFIFGFGILFFDNCRLFRSQGRQVTSQEIEAHIRFLSDDLLEGRAIGTRGLAIASLYQEDVFRSCGLEPLFNGGFRQLFELKGARPDPSATLEMFSKDVLINPKIYEDFVLKSYREDCPEGIEGEDKDFAKRKFDEYQKEKYHKITDEIEPDWDIKGTIQIARWAQEIIALLSEARDLPQFKDTSSFRRKSQ